MIMCSNLTLRPTLLGIFLSCVLLTTVSTSSISFNIEGVGGSNPHWPDPTKPPQWPKQFQANFTEVLDLGPKGKLTNQGSWYYDYDKRSARFDHLKGQRNNFCAGQNLSDLDPSADCHLLFTGTLDMWVIYPGARNCCRLCGGPQGCTVLKPDWLDGAKLVETATIEGRECAGWAKHGAVAAEDTWYQDQDGVPCRYHEVVNTIDHNLTFTASSYSTGPVDPQVFTLPDYCPQKDCPHPFPG